MPTVHSNIKELTNAGLIKMGASKKSSGGRRPHGYLPVGDAAYAASVYITDEGLRFLIMDLKLTEIVYMRIKSNPFKDLDTVGKTISVELEKLFTKSKIDRKKVLGVGIAIPAVIDREKDQIGLSPTLHLHGNSLQSLRDAINYKCLIENDGTCGGFAEWYTRQDRGNRDIAYLLLENGIGGAVMLNGAQYNGNHCRSGEFGHMCIEPGGKNCQCGKKGCLEAYCSACKEEKEGICR